MQRGPNRRNSIVAPLQKSFAVRGGFALLLTCLLTCLMAAPFVSGAELVGKVRNGTTRRSAPGDEIVLLSVSAHGIKEIEHCRADDAGTFRFNQAADGEFYRVRVIHDGVAYEETVELQAGKPAVVEVYDASEKLDGVTAIMDVERFEATNDTLEIKQLVTLRNSSKPPRTLLIDRAFEFLLPPNAEVKSGLVQVESEKPSREKPLPGDRSGLYYFRVPLRPGDTRFGVVYRLPYSGVAQIEPEVRNANERFVIILPKSMRFEPQTAGVFQSMADVSSDNVQGTAPVALDQTLAFFVSGTGILEELQDRRSQQTAAGQRQILSSELMHLVGRQHPGVNHLQSTRPPENRDAFALIGLTALIAAGTACIYFTRRKTAKPLAVQNCSSSIVRQGRRGQSRRRSKRHALP